MTQPQDPMQQPAGQQPRPLATQPKPKGRIKLTSFVIIVGAIMVYFVASQLGWYDALPDLLQP